MSFAALGLRCAVETPRRRRRRRRPAPARAAGRRPAAGTASMQVLHQQGEPGCDSCCMRSANRRDGLGVVGRVLHASASSCERADRGLELVADVRDEVAADGVHPARLGLVLDERPARAVVPSGATRTRAGSVVAAACRAAGRARPRGSRRPGGPGWPARAGRARHQPVAADQPERVRGRARPTHAVAPRRARPRTRQRRSSTDATPVRRVQARARRRRPSVGAAGARSAALDQAPRTLHTDEPARRSASAGQLDCDGSAWSRPESGSQVIRLFT